MGGIISFIRGRNERMDIFSIFSLLDTVISVTNGFIALRDNFKNAREKQKKDDMFTHADGRRYEGDLRDGAAQAFLLLAKPRLTLGRSDQPSQASDIFILDTKDLAQKTVISRFHAMLELTPHGVQIMPDKNHYQIWIERGMQTLDVTRPTMLAAHDLIRLGKQATGQGVALRYAAYYGDDAAAAEISVDKHVTLDDDAPQRSLIAARLTVERGLAPYRTIILCVGACAIGRDAATPSFRINRAVSTCKTPAAATARSSMTNPAPRRRRCSSAIRFGKNVALRVECSKIAT